MDVGRNKSSMKALAVLILLIDAVTKVEHMSVQAFGLLNHQYQHQHQQLQPWRYSNKASLTVSMSMNDDDEDEDDSQGSLSPSQLEQLLQNSRPPTDTNPSDNSTGKDENSRIRQATEAEIDAAEQIAGNVNIPKTGISVNDEMTMIQSTEKYVCQLFPLNVNTSANKIAEGGEDQPESDDSDNNFNSVAAIQTVTADSISDEPMRYVVALDQYSNDATKGQNRKYAMIDVPPYSDELVEKILEFMTIDSFIESDDKTDENDDDIKVKNTGTLSTILVTCRDGIHYDETPAVYVTRKSDLMKWKQAFPGVEIVMYRLDTPRDCKDAITQSLDGYGPWALGSNDGDVGKTFSETGRPLTRMDWDEETQVNVLDNGEVPPDDNGEDDDVDKQYTPQAIKKREENKDIIAVYTPGHTFGSVTYIFPKLQVCCSGFTMPVEDTRSSANVVGLSTAGPALDYRGYITTNSGGIERQIESARSLVAVYADRFGALLPARGPPVTLGHLPLVERQRILQDMLNEYAELGRVYESMGII